MFEIVHFTDILPRANVSPRRRSEAASHSHGCHSCMRETLSNDPRGPESFHPEALPPLVPVAVSVAEAEFPRDGVPVGRAQEESVEGHSCSDVVYDMSTSFCPRELSGRLPPFLSSPTESQDPSAPPTIFMVSHYEMDFQ